MRKNKVRNLNKVHPKNLDISVQQMYEMETNNYSDYSTETFEKLEMAIDNDFSEVLKEEEANLNEENK